MVKWITTAVMAAVVIIMVGALLVPVINDFVDDSTATYTNSTSNTATQIGSDDVTIVLSSGTLTVNSTPVTVTAGPILLSDTLVIVFNGTVYNAFGTASSAGAQIQNMIAFTATVDISESSVSVTDITLSGNTSGSNKTFDDYSWLYHVATEGANNLVNATSTAKAYYMNADNQIRGALYASGNYYTNVGSTLFKNAAEDSTDTLTFSATDVADVDDVRSITVTNSASSSGLALNYNSGANNASINWIVVPHEVSGDVPTIAPARGILLAIPVLVIIALVVGVAILAFRRVE